MICPLCPSAGFLGGLVGGIFGINPPRSSGGRYLSILTTANLVNVTIMALKVLGNISLCSGTGYTLANASIVIAKTLIMGIVYSIAVNYLLNRYVFSENSLVEESSAESFHCCCQNRLERQEATCL